MQGKKMHMGMLLELHTSQLKQHILIEGLMRTKKETVYRNWSQRVRNTQGNDLLNHIKKEMTCHSNKLRKAKFSNATV